MTHALSLPSDQQPEDAQAREWIEQYRAAGGRFQWMAPGEVWLSVPVKSLSAVADLERVITPEMRSRAVALVKPLLDANGGFY